LTSLPFPLYSSHNFFFPRSTISLKIASPHIWSYLLSVFREYIESISYCKSSFII
jgi:hypothetical protein